MQEWYLGWEKVSCLERCPQFRSVLVERERFHCEFIFNPIPTQPVQGEGVSVRV